MKQRHHILVQVFVLVFTVESVVMLTTEVQKHFSEIIWPLTFIWSFSKIMMIYILYSMMPPWLMKELPCCLLCVVISYTFEMMQQNTDNIWRFMQLQVVMDYSLRPVLPPPLIFFSHLCYLTRCLSGHCCCQHVSGQSTAFSKFWVSLLNVCCGFKLMGLVLPSVCCRFCAYNIWCYGASEVHIFERSVCVLLLVHDFMLSNYGCSSFKCL